MASTASSYTSLHVSRQSLLGFSLTVAKRVMIFVLTNSSVFAMVETMRGVTRFFTFALSTFGSFAIA
uniref:Uncharacterized protein n=1 Tax=Solanum lycopersicum TaxID=4081 RepID=A0A3Q7E876_SOLLC